MWGTWAFEVTVDGESIAREVTIRSPNRQLHMPAFGSSASPDANVGNSGDPAIVKASRANFRVWDSRVGGGGGLKPNAFGWVIAIEELVRAVDDDNYYISDHSNRLNTLEAQQGGVPQEITDELANHEQRLDTLEQSGGNGGGALSGDIAVNGGNATVVALQGGPLSSAAQEEDRVFAWDQADQQYALRPRVDPGVLTRLDALESASPGGGPDPEEVYRGYNDSGTNSLASLNQWKGFVAGMPSWIDGLTGAGISRSGSTFTVTKGGLYTVTGHCNAYQSGSNSTYVYCAVRITVDGVTQWQEFKYGGVSNGAGRDCSLFFSAPIRLPAGGSLTIEIGQTGTDSTSPDYVEGAVNIAGEQLRSGSLNIARVGA
jgi:hypothetical protein